VSIIHKIIKSGGGVKNGEENRRGGRVVSRHNESSVVYFICRNEKSTLSIRLDQCGIIPKLHVPIFMPLMPLNALEPYNHFIDLQKSS
jgi:hypothetical protein